MVTYAVVEFLATTKLSVEFLPLLVITVVCRPIGQWQIELVHIFVHLAEIEVPIFRVV